MKNLKLMKQIYCLPVVVLLNYVSMRFMHKKLLLVVLTTYNSCIQNICNDVWPLGDIFL